MSNILKGIVTIEAPGVEQVTSKVATSLGKTELALKKLSPVSNQATLALSNLSRVAQDAPYGFIGIANNLNPLLESFQRLKQSTGSTGGALKALGSSLTGAGGIGLALGVVSSLLVSFGDKLFGAGRKAKEAEEKVKELKDTIKGVFAETAKEATQAGSFVTILKSETETRERKLAAIKELQRIQPEIFNGLKLEGNAVIGLDTAYQNYLVNLKNVIAAKIIQARLEAKITELLTLQGAGSTSSEKRLRDFAKTIRDFRISSTPEDARKQFEGFFKSIDAADSNKIKTLQSDIEGLFKDLSEFSKNIKVPELKTPSLKIKPDNVILDLTNLNNNIEGGQFVDKGIFKALFGDKIFDAATSSIRIPIRFKQEQGPVEKDDGFNALMKEFAENEARLKSLAGIVSDTLTPVFNSFFTTIAQGGNAFKAFAQAAASALTGLIAKLATTALLSAIIGPLLGAGSAVGALSSKFSDVFKFLSGFGGARASGGPVEAGKVYRVNERGMEFFRPNVSGSIIPVGGGSYSGGGLGGRVVFEISGNKLIGVLANGNRSQNSLV